MKHSRTMYGLIKHNERKEIWTYPPLVFPQVGILGIKKSTYVFLLNNSELKALNGKCQRM